MSPEQQPQPSSVGQVLDYLGRSTNRRQPMVGLLQGVDDLVKTVMPGDPEASVTLLVGQCPSTVAATGQVAVELDEGQYECGRGPC